MANFAEVWKKTKVFEGGYQAMPKDNGNYCPSRGKPGSALIGTNHGISAIGMAQYLKRCPTVAEMKALSEPKAMQVAKTQYWNQVQGDRIKSQALGHLIFDITYGSSYGPLHVRRAINSIAGKDTVKEFKSFKLSDNEINLINKLPEKKLFSEIYKRRIEFYKKLEFGKGLTNRMNKLAGLYMQGLEERTKFAKRNWIPLVAVAGLIGVGLYLLLKPKK